MLDATQPTPGSEMAERIRWARSTAGLGSRELGRLAGFSEAHVAVLESRHGSLDTETAAAIARVLGVSLDWLVLGRGRKPSRKLLQSSAARARDAHAAKVAP